MTTIAYKDGIMAADSRAYSGGARPIGAKVKVQRLKDGTLIGCSSNVAGGAETVRRWAEAGHPVDFAEGLPATFTLMIAKPSGEVYYACDTLHVSGPLDAPFFSIGSGCEFAIGAMDFGACAVEAIRVACRQDVWSDLPIFAVKHDAPARWRVER